MTNIKYRNYTPQEYMDMIGRAIDKAFGKKDCLIIFFGTVVTGKLRRTSDIDVGVYCGEEIDPLVYMKILENLENLPLLRKIDLVDLATVDDKDFLEEVLTGGVVWKGSENLLNSLKERLESMKR